MEPGTKYSASKLYEAYRHFCQSLGRKPQSNSAFKKALDKLVNVYQSRTSSGIQWYGIEPLFAALLAIILLKQILSVSEWIGFFIVLTAIYTFEKNSAKPEAHSKE